MLECIREEHIDLQDEGLVHCGRGEGDTQSPFAVVQLPPERIDAFEPKQSHFPSVNPEHPVSIGIFHPLFDLRLEFPACSFAIFDGVLDLLAENELGTIVFRGSE